MRSSLGTELIPCDDEGRSLTLVCIGDDNPAEDGRFGVAPMFVFRKGLVCGGGALRVERVTERAVRVSVISGPEPTATVSGLGISNMEGVR